MACRPHPPLASSDRAPPLPPAWPMPIVVVMGRLRSLFLGSLLGGALSVVLAPRLGRFGRRGPLSALHDHLLDAFAGTPCSQESAGTGDNRAEDV